MPKPDILNAQKRYAWTSTGDKGEQVHHFKTIDEHGATIGEHTESGVPGMLWSYQVLWGRCITDRFIGEDYFGWIPLSIDCQEARERRELSL